MLTVKTHSAQKFIIEGERWSLCAPPSLLLFITGATVLCLCYQFVYYHFSVYIKYTHI
jgi:hypothetical protein